MLVIDSGSRDRSREIARAAGRDGDRDRARRSSATAARATSRWPGRAGELVAFLTQDSTPARRGLAGRARGELPAGRARGRLVRPSPAAPGREPAHQAAAARLLPRLLARAASRWSTAAATPPTSRATTPASRARRGSRSRSGTSPTPRTRRSAPTCWRPAGPRSTTPPPGVVHSHDYGLVEGFRRYFDEYRGLRDSVGQRRAASPGRRVGHRLRRSVAADRAYLAPRGALARWRARAGPPRARCTTPGGVVFGGLGERADLHPRPGARAALARPPRRRGDPPRGARPAPPPTRTRCACSPTGSCRSPPPSPFDDARESLELAWVVPPFGVGQRRAG